MGESGSLAALAPIQLLPWLLWRLKAQELQLPGASISVTSSAANCQGKWKPKELELPTGPPHWWWSQWLSWLTSKALPPRFVTFPSMTGDFEELAIPKGKLVSVYQPSVVFSSLFCPTSQPFSKSFSTPGFSTSFSFSLVFFSLPFLPTCSFPLCFAFLLTHLSLMTSLPWHPWLFPPLHMSELCPSLDACQR